eukprot:1159668-Pelagomonas_calceolata.AAC.12
MLATCLVMLTTCLHFCKQYKPSDHSSAHLPRVYFCNDLALDLAQSKEAVVEVHAHAMHGLLQKEHLVALALRGHALDASGDNMRCRWRKPGIAETSMGTAVLDGRLAPHHKSDDLLHCVIK